MSNVFTIFNSSPYKRREISLLFISFLYPAAFFASIIWCSSKNNFFSSKQIAVRITTGASAFYIITAICLDEKKLFLLEHQMMEAKNAAGYKKEIKSNEISLRLYGELLKIVNTLDIKTYYRLIDKSVYKGKFKVDGIPALHNVFDEYHVARAVAFAMAESNMKDVDIVIDRTDRRLLDGK